MLVSYSYMTVHQSEKAAFSDQLETWLHAKTPKTIGSLNQSFPGKSFAVLFLILMSVPALPIPTGGITHVFEIVVALLSLELILGVKNIWLPPRFSNKPLSPKMLEKGLPLLIRYIRKIEKLSKPRLSRVMRNTWARRVFGLMVLVLTFFAFFSVPFSGLDTLPSLGVVCISLAIILEDFAGLILGVIFGGLGIGLITGLGVVLSRLFMH